jgi:hypothetical protein
MAAAHHALARSGREARFGTARAAVVLVALAGAAGACDGQVKIIGADLPAASCDVTPAAPPASLGLDPFYKKYLDGNGIPVLASAQVSDAAVVQACTITVRMLAKSSDLRQAMASARMHAAVIGRNEVTTDIPEYRDLNTAFPNTDWNTLRGVGATMARPVVSAGEENLLCLADDIFRGENVLVQSTASAIRIGIDNFDSAFEGRLQSAFSSATAAGLWARTYAVTNAGMYFTEGVQDWFDANLQASPPNGRQNEINTRAELTIYDPALAALVSDYLPGDGWRARCP